VSEPSPAGAAPPAARSSGLLQQLGPVAIGLVVLGVGSFAYLGISGRLLGPADFAPVATLWVVFNAAALAFYQPIEQELSRATAERRAVGTGAAPVLLRCLVLGTGVTAVLAALALGFRETVADRLFNGESALVPLLLVGMVGLFAEHTLRGLFSGAGRFGRYGAQLAVDGLLRVVGPVVLVLAASHDTATVAAALVLAPLLAAVATAGRPRRLAHQGPPAAWGTVAPALATLVGAAVLSQLIVNAAPIAAQLLSGGAGPGRVGSFIAALVMTRIPLFFFGAVQATFLPALSKYLAEDDLPGFRRQVRTVVLLVAGVSGLFLAGLAVLGPWALRLLYGPDFDASRGLLTLLGAGAAAYMLAQAMAQVLIALQVYRGPLLGWAAGSAVFLAALAVPLGVEGRVSLALLAGGVVAAGVMTVGVVRAVARRTAAQNRR
jgi:O-antigen/teichoic acid export membrane protein